MTTSNHPPLPQSTASVSLQILEGGSFSANLEVVHADSASKPFKCQSWVIYIYHKASGRHILWDVGLSADRSDYTAYINQHILDVLHPVPSRLSLPEQLRRKGVHAESLDTVLFRNMFPNATGYFGPGTFSHCTPGQFHDEPYQEGGKWDANFFHPERATERCEELQGEWQNFGPFESALDFLGDGSLWIIEAPGHMAGNLAAAARLASGEWVILASDCCHSKALLDGEFDFKTWKNDLGETECLHEDLLATRETVKKLRILERDYGAHIVLAHDSSWMLAGTNDVLMSLLDDDIRSVAEDRLSVNENR